MSEPAEIRVTNVRRVFHNGEHNAFTSLIRFRDRYYLSFRSCPDGHYAYPTSSLIILASDDAAMISGQSIVCDGGGLLH